MLFVLLTLLLVLLPLWSIRRNADSSSALKAHLLGPVFGIVGFVVCYSMTAMYASANNITVQFGSASADSIIRNLFICFLLAWIFSVRILRRSKAELQSSNEPREPGQVNGDHRNLRSNAIEPAEKHLVELKSKSVDDLFEELRGFGYKCKKVGQGFVVKEPLGGRKKCAELHELERYADFVRSTN